MEVVVTSRDTITPSSPTPDHLRHFQLSYLDQIVNPNIVPLIFYYPLKLAAADDQHNDHKHEQLKKSLSETLTKFYPLAGRLKDELYIDCNDEGVLYLEAEAKCSLSLIVFEQSKNDQAELNKLLPLDRLEDAGDILLAIQVTVFNCGGIAIGICFSHKTTDGFSTSIFVNSWAASTRAEPPGKMAIPLFDSAKHFPPRDMSCYQKTGTGMTNDRIIAKRFVFSASAVSALKNKYAHYCSIQPTRVEALSTFLWSRFVVSTTPTTTDQDDETIFVLTQGVNLRSRADPPLPESCFGNFSWFTVVKPSMDKSVEEGYGLVPQMREAIRKIDGDYVNKIKEGIIHLTPLKGNGRTTAEMSFVSFNVTSFCKFQLYEVDFGWGRPIWVSMGVVPLKNQVVLMPTSGDGIEVWINLTEDDMPKFETDQQLLEFVNFPNLSGVVVGPNVS